MCETGKFVCKILLAALALAAVLAYLKRPREPKYIEVYAGNENEIYG